MRRKRDKNKLRDNPRAVQAAAGFGGNYVIAKRSRKERVIERPELFLIPNDTIFALDAVETEATYDAMEELGIASLPYPLVDVGVEGSLIMRISHDKNGEHAVFITEPVVPGSPKDQPHDPLTCPHCQQQADPGTKTSSAKTVGDKVIPAGSPIEDIFKAVNELDKHSAAPNSTPLNQWPIAKEDTLDAAMDTANNLRPNSPYNVAYAPEDIRVVEGQGDFTRQFKTIRDLKESSETYGTAFKEWSVRFRFENEQSILHMLVHPAGRAYDLLKVVDQDERAAVASSARSIRKILIVLLATRNITKERTKDKLLSMGIGTKKNNYRPLYTTTLTLPRAVTKDDGQPASVGAMKRPHLRRGHIRHQKYGPKLAFTKLIWIEPCFINADEDFVSTRSAYNTSMGTNHPLHKGTEDAPRID